MQRGSVLRAAFAAATLGAHLPSARCQLACSTWHHSGDQAALQNLAGSCSVNCGAECQGGQSSAISLGEASSRSACETLCEARSSDGCCFFNTDGTCLFKAGYGIERANRAARAASYCQAASSPPPGPPGPPGRLDRPDRGSPLSHTCGQGQHVVGGSCSDAARGITKLARFTGTFCHSCARGQYQQYTGQSSCLSCLEGKYSNSVAASFCTNCPTGQYQNHEGRTSCIDCEIGQYQSYTGQTGCISCASSAYQNSRGQPSCISCQVTQSSDAGTTPCPAVDTPAMALGVLILVTCIISFVAVGGCMYCCIEKKSKALGSRPSKKAWIASLIICICAGPLYGSRSS